MHIGVRDVIIQHAGFSTIREGLRALGVEAVELALSRDLSVTAPDATLIDPRHPMRTPADVADARLRYEEANVRVGAILMANNFNSHNREAEVEWVAEGVRIAAGLGATVVRIDAAMTGQQELSLERRVDLFASAVRDVLGATSELPVPLAIENHGLQGNDPEWLRAVLDAVASARLGLTLDTGNFYWAGMPLERVYETMERFASEVKHVHCKNLAFEPERQGVDRELGWGYGEHVCPIPDGDVDHGRVLDVLRAAGYDGGLYIEDESLGKFDGSERAQQLVRDVEHLKGLVG